MADRPQTPAGIADALRGIADQIAAMPNPDTPRGWVAVALRIQPHTGAEVDEYSTAVYGIPAEDHQMSAGTWHRTTCLSGRHTHPSGVQVEVYTSIEDPQLAAARVERDELAAELAELRKARDRFVAACSYCGSLDHEMHTFRPGDPIVHPNNEVPRRWPSAAATVGPAICRHRYTRPGGADRGDRTVACALPSGHPGDHREADTEVTWT